MSAVVAARPKITPTDRLGLTLCLAILVHGIIVLGISFTTEDQFKPHYDTMEIILVQQKDKDAPKDAKMLAQASMEGGGSVSQDVTPANPMPPPFPDTTPDVSAPPPAESQKPAPDQKSLNESPAKPPSNPEKSLNELVVEAPAAEKKLAEVTKKPKKPTQKNTPEQVAKSRPKKPRPSATALLTNSFKIAALSAEIKQKLEAKSQRPKRKFISASTQEYRYAAYMEAWRAKVERVGNLNYPEEARKRKLSGSLILDVALNPDGDIRQITVRRSSGHKILDDAAIRIVKLASPFSPFPDGIRKDTDILHITRTWQFLDNRGFR